MLRQEKNFSAEEALALWPRSYDEATDPDFREELLLRRIAAQNDPADEERLAIFRLRYDARKKDKKAQPVRVDKFMRAWMNISITEVGRFNRKRAAREVKAALTELGVSLDGDPASDTLKAEWRNLAACYIGTCLQSRSYGRTLFGLLSVGDDGIAQRIADDVDCVTRRVPEALGLEAETRAFRTSITGVYIDMIDNGKEHLALAQEK